MAEHHHLPNTLKVRIAHPSIADSPSLSELFRTYSHVLRYMVNRLVFDFSILLSLIALLVGMVAITYGIWLVVVFLIEWAERVVARIGERMEAMRLEEEEEEALEEALAARGEREPLLKRA